jgi:DNA-binding MarR family transcriptional regulator
VGTTGTAVRSELGLSLSLEAFLPYRLNVLATLVSTALARIYDERFGLTIPGWRILATLGSGEATNAQAIAAHAVMHKSTVSRAVAALETRGLVERRPNPADLREERLALTPAGREVYEALVPEALAFEAAFASALNPAERRQFFEMLMRLDRHARGFAAAGPAEAE